MLFLNKCSYMHPFLLTEQKIEYFNSRRANDVVIGKYTFDSCFDFYDLSYITFYLVLFCQKRKKWRKKNMSKMTHTCALCHSCCWRGGEEYSLYNIMLAIIYYLLWLERLFSGSCSSVSIYEQLISCMLTKIHMNE